MGINIYSEMLSNLKKEGNPSIYNNMNEPYTKWHYAKWNKPDTEGQILNDHIMYEI